MCVVCVCVCVCVGVCVCVVPGRLIENTDKMRII